MTQQETFNPVYILGNTPLADFLAAKLSLAGENIYRLATHQSETIQTYILKDLNRGQKQSVCLPTGCLMHHPAKMTILCLNPNTLKSDLSYFSMTKVGTTPVISFCHTDYEFLNKIIKRPIIPAYFDGWLESKNDTLTFSGAPHGITVSISEQNPLFEDIRQVLAKTEIELHFIEEDSQNFWTYFIPETISTLFMLDNHTPLHNIAKKNELRQKLNSLIKEFSTIIPSHIKYDIDEIASYIYGLPDHYTPPLILDLANKKKGELLYLFSILQKQPSFNSINCPNIMRILQKNCQRILSPVEE